MNPSSDQFDEYKLPGDEPEKKSKMTSEKPDSSEYMMKPGRKLTKDLHEYYNENGYQYGKRKKKP